MRGTTLKKEQKVTSVKHKPAGGITTPGGLTNKQTNKQTDSGDNCIPAKCGGGNCR